MIECYKLRAHRFKGSLNIDYLFLPSTGLVTVKGEVGSGKTTFLKSLAGLTEHFGKIVIDDGLKHSRYTSNFAYNNFFERHRYETTNFKETLYKMMGVYGLKDHELIVENSKKYLRAFDLTLNTSYDSCSPNERSLFTLALILALGCNVVLFDELFENIDPVIRKEVCAVLEEYALCHLVLLTLPAFELKIHSDKEIELKNGTVVFESESVTEHFYSPKFRRNDKFNLMTFSLLPHLKSYAKILLAGLTVVFIFAIAIANLPFTTRNAKALNEISGNLFVNVSQRHESVAEDIFIDSSNHLLTITHDSTSARDFKIRPDYIKSQLIDHSELKLSVSLPLARLLDVSKGDKVKLAGLEWTIATIHDIDYRELYLPLPYFLTMAHLNTDTTYTMRASDYSCAYYDADGQVSELRSGIRYYSDNLEVDESIDKASYGFYRIKDGYKDVHLVLESEPNYDRLLNLEAPAYVYYYRNIFNLGSIAKHESADFVYNRLTPHFWDIALPLTISSLYLILILAIFIRADKGTDDYYKSFSKNKYVSLQALKFFSFTFVVAFCSFLLLTSIIREGFILLTTGIYLIGTLIAFLFLYLIIDRLYVTDW